MVEDDPQRLADKLVELIENGPVTPRNDIRRALESVFGDSRLKMRLEAFVQKAVHGARASQTEEQAGKFEKGPVRMGVGPSLTIH